MALQLIYGGSKWPQLNLMQRTTCKKTFAYIPFIRLLNGSQLAKFMKDLFSYAFCHEIYRAEAVASKKLHLYLKITICKSWGNFLKNRYFDNNCFIKNRISEFFCTHVTYVIVIIFRAANFVSNKSIFVNYRFPIPILHF